MEPAAHLSGWLIASFIPCVGGQQLINEVGTSILYFNN